MSQIRVGDKLRYNRKIVEVIAEADAAHKVVIKDKENRYIITTVDKLKPLEENMIKCWWHKNHLHIVENSIYGEDSVTQHVTIPASQVAKLIAIASEPRPDKNLEFKE